MVDGWMDGWVGGSLREHMSCLIFVVVSFDNSLGVQVGY